jgi:hypothetical protein
MRATDNTIIRRPIGLFTFQIQCKLTDENIYGKVTINSVILRRCVRPSAACFRKFLTGQTFIFFILQLHPNRQSTSRFHKDASCANFTARFTTQQLFLADQTSTLATVFRLSSFTIIIIVLSKVAIHIKISSAAVRPRHIHVFCAN